MQASYPLASTLLAWVAFCASACLPGAPAQAATQASSIAIAPPPGLYQVELVATTALVKSGGGPETRCIKPYKFVPGNTDEILVKACSKQTNKVMDDHTMVNTAECLGMGSVMTTTITKIGAQVYDVETRIQPMPPAQGSADPMSGKESALRLQAAQGETAAQREEAQKELQAMAQLKEGSARQRQEVMDRLRDIRDNDKAPEMRASAAKALADMQQVRVPAYKAVVFRQRLTRIGDCDVPAGPMH